MELTYKKKPNLWTLRTSMEFTGVVFGGGLAEYSSWNENAITFSTTPNSLSTAQIWLRSP